MEAWSWMGLYRLCNKCSGPWSEVDAGSMYMLLMANRRFAEHPLTLISARAVDLPWKFNFT